MSDEHAERAVEQFWPYVWSTGEPKRVFSSIISAEYAEPMAELQRENAELRGRVDHYQTLAESAGETIAELEEQANADD